MPTSPLRDPSIEKLMTRVPFQVTPNLSLEEALALMEERGIRHLPVVENRKLIGVISDRDIAHSLSRSGQATITVAEIMSRDPYAAYIDSDLAEVLQIMAGNRLGCVVIKDRGECVVGIFTTTDAVLALSELVQKPNLLSGA